MKSKFVLSVSIALAAAIMPLAAAAQIAPDKPKTEREAPAFKYEAFGMFAYTSLNQVNQSRYGLMGAKFGATRDLGRYFGVTGIADYYKPATGSPNPGDPSVYDLLAGPELHVPLVAKVDGILHGLMGYEHTGGEAMRPSGSFAGGFGGGLDYNVTPRIAIRASGDRIGASFSLSNNTPQLAYSPHLHWNARGEVGLVVRF